MQVKIEDQAEYSGMNADAESLRDAAWDPPPTRVKEEVTCSLTISSCRDGQPSSSSCNLRLQFIAMGFSEKLVDKVLQQHGDDDSDTILGYLLSYPGKVQSLFSVMDRSVGLLHMGFTEEEVSWAIGNFGQEATITDLADHIFARRIANSIEQKEVKVESDFLDETETEFSTYRTSCFGVNYEDDDGYGRDHTRVKRAKTIFVDDREASSSHSNNPRFMGRCSRTNGLVKEEPEAITPGWRVNVRGDVASPPYFIYCNVVEIPKDTWHRLSQFLYNVEPEFLNSQFFSALTRNEGYLHNLPMERRHAVVPKSPMTIEEALPFTRQWWPSWDTRKHISVVSIEAAGIEQTCERLGRMARESRVVLSHDRQMHIVHQCKASNLVWVGQDKLSPLEPRQLERILGYPNNHTDLFGLSQQERFAALKFAFQTDTLAYLLSVLKDKYPSGMRVLSIYSGIGGAEVTLHRLGIRLKCVVSVEQSDINRKILRRWWGKTEQKGELRQYPGIGAINTTKIENLIAEFGGFDLIIGGNYNSYRGGTTINATMGLDAQHFYEYARVVKSFRSAVGLH
ncbi:hypothetical protein PR202_gb24986 [Eleusine coracana subsp. coracana]|uniref:SAM-dependent MTase DRM-type domain-containing protein n=1 Tax=Eleusine coracana subsp. coracana TaxID=191504 RepID=A0AAV5FNF0_ELECO|nr:hypothetical protein PR202_gb24986 [Eleusine coracana subsp. coracana]